MYVDLEFGAHRARSNTAARLEKMDRDRKRAAKTKHIKWEGAHANLSSMLILFCPWDKVSLQNHYITFFPPRK